MFIRNQNPGNRSPQTQRTIRTLLCLASLGLWGCGGVQTREASLRRLTSTSADHVDSHLPLDSVSKDVLRRHGIFGADAETAAVQLEFELRRRGESDANNLLTLAELWYRVGVRSQKSDPIRGLLGYRNAASLASIVIGQGQGGGSAEAIELHNKAVTNLLRSAEDERVRSAGSWRDALAMVDVSPAGETAFVDPARFSTVQPASDVQVRGMRNEYRGVGVGVPLVATRLVDREHPTEAEESYFPPNLRVCTTVVARASGDFLGGGWRTMPLSLVFFDPFQTRRVTVGGRVLPMAYDTTTPLAFQASQSLISFETLAGLVFSEFQSGIKPGLYMLRPYQTGKIPVVFVHGLNSNPGAFVQTINDLRNDPVITERYQFLLFAYPTGKPIPTSAASLRRALYKLESDFGSDPAFHNMVVVGHSMGGNLTRFMVTDSGSTLWNHVFTVPFEKFRASEETRAKLTELMFFRPVPFVRHAIFIAAPHKGTRLADLPLGRLAGRLVRPSDEQRQVIDEIHELNGPETINRDALRNKSITSIGNLSSKSPVLLAIDSLPISPNVDAHTIAFEFLDHFPSDLAVASWSSRIPGVVSESVNPGTHFSEQSPKAVAEIRRILMEIVQE